MSSQKPTQVYCATIGNKSVIKNGEISHKTRAAEISAARNSKVKEQKIFAWKLLEYALFDFAKIIPDENNVVKRADGKWVFTDGKIFFSLSHTDGFCAVAVSFCPCGVDAERFTDERFSPALAKKILSESELSLCEKLDEHEKQTFCYEKWTQKESIFKMTDDETFVAKKISTDDFITDTRKITAGEDIFFLSVCSQDAKDAKVVIL